jgi:F-type H+-transporting ATPase subunit delta
VISVIARRYAEALAEIVLVHNSPVRPEDALSQLRSFVDFFEQTPPLHGALMNPAVPAARKRAVISRLGEEIGVATPVRNFLFLLVDHRRIALLPPMADAFEAAIDEHRGVARADISSARPLDAPRASAIEAQLARISGRQIRARYHVDESLLGGVLARVGGTVYDGSVRGTLEELRRDLRAGPAGH